MENLEIVYAIAPWIIPLILGGLSAGQGALNYFGAKREGELEREHDMALAEYQYSKDLQMWNIQNEYNAPAQQMQRLRDAGLNPNLMYGQGNVGNATTMPKYNAPKMQYPFQPMFLEGLNSVLSQYADMKTKNLERERLFLEVGMNHERLAQEQLKTSDLADSTRAKYEQSYHQQVTESDIRKRALEVDKLAIDRGISAEELEWKKLKMMIMRKARVNIERDSLLERRLGEEINSLFNWFRRKFAPVKNFIDTN